MLILPMFINMVFYIITIITCTASSTLYLRYVFRKKGTLYKAVSILLLSFLAYAVLEMFVTFFTELHISKELFYTLTTLSDVTYFFVVSSWLSTIVIISGNPYIIRIRGFLVYTIIYGVSVDGLNLISKFNPSTFGLKPEEVSHILLCINCVFDITLICIGVFFIFYGIFKMYGEKEKKWVLLFSSCLVAYMIYITNWDIISCKDEVPNHVLFSSFDPAHIFYVVMCLLTVYMVSKKDSLRTGYYMPEILGITDTQEKDWETVAREYKLTSRELEVLIVTFSGLSNPDIAKKLYISESTVKQHLSHIYRKMGVKNRYELLQKIKF